ncbi:nucleotidyltransferase [Ameyamaea chiangmaiensis NBRC 103196]|uniref:DUF4113 domain-containing protein n=1 Tax=Ameyamaea chiangmaiensis TaxID=442969 RepID=A0A850PD75_9PROT|nr:DUF4113 domain-containing protein [Ameyamaea chiangmaiensis]MBS4075497.1 DUF4113 domain-containing protein [Ameyamaea chiangmaiensis]NVN38971.1 DUF4113 domain-containing protein [Ameyamaea chiangmaiensis]GBQ69528.1 nucleotidyltransferase [Ameyamaea chiangmaiensis NBRC 103196]
MYSTPTHAIRAAEKLRREGLEAAHVSVFVQTNPHNGDTWYANQRAVTIEATADTRVLVRTAARLLDHVWRDGLRYFKGGVILSDLSPAGEQGTLLASQPAAQSDELMAALDAINARHGLNTVRLAGGGVRQTWTPRQGMLSKRYTTRFSDILSARAW